MREVWSYIWCGLTSHESILATPTTTSKGFVDTRHIGPISFNGPGENTAYEPLCHCTTHCMCNVCMIILSTLGGQIAVYGDSNCLDSAHLQRGIYNKYIHVYMYMHVHVRVCSVNSNAVCYCIYIP